MDALQVFTAPLLTPFDYMEQCQRIHLELAAIADRTRGMALGKCADPSNPDFVATMDRQDVLHNALKGLDAAMLPKP
jgi:hypothetical protein